MPITNRTAVTLWIVYGAVLAAAAFVPLVVGSRRPQHEPPERVADDDLRRHGARNRVQRAHQPPRSVERAHPAAPAALAVSLVPIALIFLATQLPSLQPGMLTTPLNGPQWLEAIGLALALPVVIEANKWLRRRRAPAGEVLDVGRAVSPARIGHSSTP